MSKAKEFLDLFETIKWKSFRGQKDVLPSITDIGGKKYTSKELDNEIGEIPGSQDSAKKAADILLKASIPFISSGRGGSVEGFITLYTLDNLTTKAKDLLKKSGMEVL